MNQKKVEDVVFTFLFHEGVEGEECGAVWKEVVWFAFPYQITFLTGS